MLLRKTLLPLVTLVLGLTAVACGSSYYAVRIPPPPPPRYGVLGYAPGPGYVWVDGFWDLRGGRWFWSPGRWVLPPRHRAVWVSPYWAPRGRGYYFRADTGDKLAARRSCTLELEKLPEFVEFLQTNCNRCSLCVIYLMWGNLG